MGHGDVKYGTRGTRSMGLVDVTYGTRGPEVWDTKCEVWD